MCAQRTVDLSLDGTYCQEIVSFRHHAVAGQALRHFIVALAAHHYIEAYGQRALCFEFL